MKRILKYILSIYWGEILLLLFYYTVLQLVFAPELFNSREIIIILVWLPFLTVPAILLNKKYFYLVVKIVVFLFFFLEILHLILVKAPVSATSIITLMNTNFYEAKEFVSVKGAYKLLLLLPLIVIFLFEYPNTKVVNKYVVLCSLLFSMIFIVENYVNNRLLRKGVPNLIKAIVYTRHQLKNFPKKEIPLRNLPMSLKDSTNSYVVVLVVGESLNRNHMSLYGYERNTTPLLSSRKDIIVYDDVVAPYSNTLECVFSIFSGYIDTIKADLIDVFHSLRFKTYWLSNQNPFGIWDNYVTLLARKADYTKFVNTHSNSSFEATYVPSYDEKLLEPLAKVMQDTAKRKFIVLHLLGNHSSYSKRYPRKFAVFSGSGEVARTRAEYDNSVLYNDFVVDSIINIVKKYSKGIPAIVIYTSDHGENVYDKGNVLGHHFSDKLPGANVEIPLIVWLSEAYKRLFPGKPKVIRRNSSLPFSTRNLFYSILDLLPLRDTLGDSLSIFNSDYKVPDKRIVCDSIVYDN